MIIVGILLLRLVRGFAGDCEPPLLLHGHVNGSGSSSSWTGSLSCLPGFTLVGSSKVKCREGQWSGDIPVCTKLEGCDPGDLPGLEHGRKYSYSSSRYRGGVYKYSCYKGYHLVGANIVWCDEGKWSLGEQETFCAKSGCDESLVSYIHNGDSTKKLDGAVFTFSCKEDGVLEGPIQVVCDGQNWSSHPPQCLGPTSPPSVSLEVGGNLSPSIAAGDLVTIVCNAKGGNPQPMLSLYLNHTPIGEPREAQNLHTFLAKPEHNQAAVTCSAVNSVMEVPAVSSIWCNVLFGPSSATITGPSHLQSGQSATLTCLSSSSNPPAVLHWSVVDSQGRQLDTWQAGEDNTTWSGTGWRTSSTLKLGPISHLAHVHVQCAATNKALQQKVADRLVLATHTAPADLTISLLSPHPAPGSTVLVECVSSPSVPPARLNWAVVQDSQREEFVPVEEVEKMENGRWVTKSVLEFVAGDVDEIIVECHAKHEVLGDDTNMKAKSIKIERAPEKISEIPKPSIKKAKKETEARQNQSPSVSILDAEKENLHTAIPGSAVIDSKSTGSTTNSFIMMPSVYICFYFYFYLYS